MTPRPFLRVPSSCANPLTTTMSFTTWAQPVTGASESDTEAAPVACSQPPFTPTIEAKPSTNVADAPSGLHVDVHLPQKDNEDPDGLGEADLRDATVILPPGLAVNPSSANGLGACSLAQIGYQGVKEGKPSFSTEPANCPDASKIGNVEIDAPAVDHPLPGAIYLAKQSENPFNSLLALYIAVNDPQTGLVIKLPGVVETDPVTGQIHQRLRAEPAAALRRPQSRSLPGRPGSPPDPADLRGIGERSRLHYHDLDGPLDRPRRPHRSPQRLLRDGHCPRGGACAATKAALPNAPSFEAGTANPLAGAYSPFLLRLKREDGSQELKGLNVTLPLGLSARFAGTAECPAAGVAQAQSRDQPRPGCPRAGFTFLPSFKPTRHRHRRQQARAQAPSTPRARPTSPAPIKEPRSAC